MPASRKPQPKACEKIGLGAQEPGSASPAICGVPLGRLVGIPETPPLPKPGARRSVTDRGLTPSATQKIPASRKPQPKACEKVGLDLAAAHSYRKARISSLMVAALSRLATE